ncbi:MAG TPA: NUDIX hydrolase [Pseudonocardiaceae bacterium]|jgi:ADP-ribose pyrophosphatase YjhB (NUDIX family)|nr:NUDIX hydrolase [Pseudonocardiaceae bacterium]
MSVEQYVAGLNRKIIGAGVLFLDAMGRVLLVEPSYKPDWTIPGGAVETDESPWAAAARELSEEVGLDRPVGQLLVVDYVRPQNSLPECVAFVFDGGMLDETEVAGMVFPDGEIISASFHTLAEARSKVKPLLADRLDVAVQAVEHGVTALCEQGRRIT